MRNRNTDVVTLDLYCLDCGYNLRGQAGDPRRCPECGHLNALEDLQVPAKLIRRALRRLETGAALCGASAATMLLFVFPLLIVIINPPMGPPPVFVWMFVATLSVVAMILYIVGTIHFRRSCAGKSRWLPALLWFSVLACLIASTGLAAIAAVLSFAKWPALSLNLDVVARIGVAVALLALSAWFYRVAKRAIHSLQRETAARFARARFCDKE